MDNNIFDFATSELSQDAMICWIVNWYNDKTSKLYPLAVSLLKSFIDFDEEVDTEISIQRQLFKIDILIYFKESGKTVILEDKVYSSEHNNQIEEYKNMICKLSNEDKHRFKIDKVQEYNITTVYFKTGFFYDNDKLVVADKVIKGIDFLKIIEPYKDSDCIIEMYYKHLKQLIEWYNIYGDFRKTTKESFWDWNISKYQIAQYNLMRSIFPKDMWNKNELKYMVYHGSNKGGIPWTEMVIYQGKFTTRNELYDIFWRIDTDKKGPYISLRFYDNYDKNNDDMKQEHLAKYKEHRHQIEEIFASSINCLWDWNEVNPGKTENYKEASLMSLHIQDILKNWEDEKEEFIKKIIFITNEVLRKNAE